VQVSGASRTACSSNAPGLRRPAGSTGGAIGGFALFLFFAYALSWACACLGMVSRGPESAQDIGLATLFPLAILVVFAPLAAFRYRRRVTD
jgi:hypothetical protein